jgi:integrating conjugative element protein (TIGR03757 family)
MICSRVALSAEIWVVTDHQHPVHAPPDARVTYLDAASHIEHELSSALPAESARAAAVVQGRLSRGGIVLQRALAAAYQGVADAWSAGITKIPAVIVDRRYVVYGEPKVERALREIEQHRSTTP